jgi:hypothetical protein
MGQVGLFGFNPKKPKLITKRARKMLKPVNHVPF